MKLIRNIFKLSQHKKFKFVYNMGSNFHKFNFSASAVVINNKFLPIKKSPLGVKELIHLVLKVPPNDQLLQFFSIMKDIDLKSSAGFTKAARP